MTVEHEPPFGSTVSWIEQGHGKVTGIRTHDPMHCSQIRVKVTKVPDSRLERLLLHQIVYVGVNEIIN